MDALIDGFASPDTGVVSAPGEVYPREVLERVFEDMAGARGFTRYVALVDGEVACAGSMRLFEGVAQLCGAATRPRFRRRGLQTAMLHARLRDAAARRLRYRRRDDRARIEVPAERPARRVRAALLPRGAHQAAAEPFHGRPSSIEFGPWPLQDRTDPARAKTSQSGPRQTAVEPRSLCDILCGRRQPRLTAD